MAAESIRITSTSLEAALLQTATIRDGHDLGRLFSERLAATTKWLHMRADQHLGEATKPIKGIEKILETGCRLASMASITSAGSAEPDKEWGRERPSFFWLIDKNMKT